MADKLQTPGPVVLPDWMGEKTGKDNTGGSQKTNGFVRKTINGISKVILYDLTSERLAARQGLLQAFDPRVKLVSILVFMFFTAMTRSFLTLFLLTAMVGMMVFLSNIGFRTYVKRVWMVIPLILLVLSIPAATNLFIKGEVILYIYRDTDLRIGSLELPRNLYFTLQGVRAVLKTTLRVGISISFGYLLITTTRWSHITKALAVLRVPKMLIAILDMTYRYIFVLCSVAAQMFEARSLRTVGALTNRENRRFIGHSIGFLFIKASHWSEEIYDSMVCRGYTGETVSMKEFRLCANDYIWIMNTIIIAIILLVLK